MKKVLLIISISFLCISQSFAEKRISKADFELLVDYANSKYLMKFIEKHDAGKPYIKDTYEKKVKPELEKSTLNNLEVISFQTIIQLLQNNIPAQVLAKKIEERKLKYADFSDDESLINSLRAESWEGIDLSMIATNLQDEILIKYDLNYNNALALKSIEQNNTLQKDENSQVKQL